MKSHTINDGLTAAQRQRVAHFLNLFADVESALKTRLKRPANDKTGVGTLIGAYEGRNPLWINSANRLRHLADIRNVLTHQRGSAAGFPIAVTPRTVAALCEIRKQLVHPVPVSAKFCREVKTVRPTDSLGQVVGLAFENGFSQFPVLEGNRFCGLITENEITRWLGRKVRANTLHVDLSNVSVITVLKEKDPTMKGMAVFCFSRPDAPTDEVMGRFLLEPTLEVVLLTRSGGKHTPIEGIVTQWDAARYL